MTSVLVGTSGWSYPSWRPGFYPAGTAQEDLLRVYASRLPTVELNATVVSDVLTMSTRAKITAPTRTYRPVIEEIDPPKLVVVGVYATPPAVAPPSR